MMSDMVEGTHTSATAVLFVGGIHGVGKSRLSATLAAQLQFPHVTAGSLIQSGADSEHSAGKAVDDLEANQSRLLTALERRRHAAPGLLLDGHFCLLGPDAAIQPIPLTVFESIAPYALLLLTDDPIQIQTRLQQRDGHHYTLAFLERFQQQETAHAERVSADLHIPLGIIRGTTAMTDALAFLSHIAPPVQ